MKNRRIEERCVGECMVIETYRGTLTEDLNLRGVLLIDLIWCCGEWNHVDRDLLTRAVEIVCHGTVERQGISPKGKIFSDLFLYNSCRTWKKYETA